MSMEKTIDKSRAIEVVNYETMINLEVAPQTIEATNCDFMPIWNEKGLDRARKYANAKWWS